MAVFDPTTPDEVWYPIPDFPGYQFSSDWRVRSFWGRAARQIRDKWFIKAPVRIKNGYVTYRLYRDKKLFQVYLHHLIALMAYGTRPDGLHVLHRDDDKDNNFPSNLSYGTVSQNMRDALRNGGRLRGGEHGQAKMTEDNIRDIRRSYAAGENQCHLAERFGVCQQLISRVVHRKAWRHVE